MNTRDRAFRRAQSDRAKARIRTIRETHAAGSSYSGTRVTDDRPYTRHTIGWGYMHRKGNREDWGFRPERISEDRAISEQISDDVRDVPMYADDAAMWEAMRAQDDFLQSFIDLLPCPCGMPDCMILVDTLAGQR